MARCAFYLRVSRDDDRQTTENQRIELEEFARGWRIVGTHEDRASRGKSLADLIDRMRDWRKTHGNPFAIEITSVPREA